MNYPPWEVPFLGGGMLIAAIATLHVFISHFAVGGGLFLVWTEARAYRTGNAKLLAFVKRHTSVFVLIVMVLGAVSGVGIWWTIGLVNPAATSALLHVFLWAWGIEWVLFAVEVVAAFTYYYGWDTLDRRTHLIVGWIYFVTAWLSLVVINGILTFMLTPGQWLQTHALADAWLNPTMLPSLVVRTAVCVALAGLWALLTVSTVEDPTLRLPTIRYAALWVLAGMAVLPPGGAWYISRLPPMAREISMGGAAAITMFAAMSVAISVAIVIITVVAAYWRPEFFNVVIAALLAGMGLSVTGVTEMVREAVRKPFVIYDYMYSNTVRVDDQEAIRGRGVLASARWVTLHAPEPSRPNRTGHELFRIQCGSCHTIDGNLGIRPMVKGWSLDLTDHQIEHLSELKGYMPPFLGTRQERQALARWLVALGQGKPLDPPPADEPLPDELDSGQLVLPAPDPLGLPSPARLLEALLAITFVLHLIPMNLVLAGAPLAAWAAWRSHRRGLSPPDTDAAGSDVALLATLAHILPAATAFTITLGIAPLLFVQVVYGPFFYTAAILIAWPWLGILALLLTGYYSTYAIAHDHATHPMRTFVLALAATACFGLIGLVFTRVSTLMLDPTVFAPMFFADRHGLNFDLAPGTTLPRFLHFLVGAFAVTGLALALLARAGLVAGKRDDLEVLGKRIFRDATLLQLGTGVLFLFSLPPPIRQSFLGASPMDTFVLLLSIGLAVVAIVVVDTSGGIAAAAIGLTLLGMSWTRHRLRVLMLAPFLRPEGAPPPPLFSGPFLLFVATLVGGVAVALWMLRAFRRSRV